MQVMSRLKAGPEKRGALSEDELLASAGTDFRVKVHKVIVDMIDSIHRSFSANAKLCSDFSCLDTRNFAHTKEKKLCLSFGRNKRVFAEG